MIAFTMFLSNLICPQQTCDFFFLDGFSGLPISQLWNIFSGDDVRRVHILVTPICPDLD